MSMCLIGNKTLKQAIQISKTDCKQVTFKDRRMNENLKQEEYSWVIKTDFTTSFVSFYLF